MGGHHREIARNETGGQTIGGKKSREKKDGPSTSFFLNGNRPGSVHKVVSPAGARAGNTNPFRRLPPERGEVGVFFRLGSNYQMAQNAP